jgi:hypothetical protein
MHPQGLRRPIAHFIRHEGVRLDSATPRENGQNGSCPAGDGQLDPLGGRLSSHRLAPIVTLLFAVVVALIAWVAWIPAASLQRAARGENSSVSVFPVLPVFPLAAAGIAFWGNQAGHEHLIHAVCVSHLVLLAAMLLSIARSRRLLSRRAREQNGA